ncbi:MAG: LysR family transcriptional regulator substrate-binding protein, partial [Clostridiales bacterium]|nr:LysR family transcriptional regulator substrate-binding protein [Clostridiales bacterium]
TGNFFNQYHVNQVKAFQDMYPDIHLHIKVENSRSLYKQIKDGNLMMGVLRETEMSHWEEEHFMIFNDALQIAAAQPITEEYLMSAPMIRNLINPYLSNIVSEWIMSMYELVPVKSYIDITGDSRNVVAMIRAGLGWGILTESRLQSMDNLFLKPIHKTDGTPYRLNTYFVYRKEAYQYAAYSSYIDHFCAYFTQQRLKPIHE